MIQTLKLQFFDLLGTAEAVYLDISENIIDDWIEHGLRDMVAMVTQINPGMLDYMAVVVTLTSGPTDVSAYQRSSIVGIRRDYLDSSLDTHNVPVREVPAILGGALEDSNSVHYAMKEDPGLFFKGASLIIIPAPSATENGYIHHVAYGQVDCAVDTSISEIASTNFPDELTSAILLFAVIQAKIREFGIVRKQGWDNISSIMGDEVISVISCTNVASKVITHNLRHPPSYRVINSAGEEQHPEVDDNVPEYLTTTFTFVPNFTGNIYLYNTVISGGLLEQFSNAIPTWSSPTPPTISAFSASFSLTLKPGAVAAFSPTSLTAKPNASSFTPSFSLTVKPSAVAAFSPNSLTAIPSLSSFSPSQSLTALLDFSSFSPDSVPTFNISASLPTVPDISGGGSDVVITTLPVDLDLARFKNALDQAAGFIYKYWDEDAGPAAPADDIIAIDAYDYIAGHDTEEAKLAIEASNAFSRVGEAEVKAQLGKTEQWISEVRMLMQKYEVEVRAAGVDVEALAANIRSEAQTYSAKVSASANGYSGEISGEARTYAARLSGEAAQISAEADTYSTKIQSDARQYSAKIQAEATVIAGQAQAYTGQHSADVRAYGARVQAEVGQIGAEAQAYAAEESVKAKLYADRVNAEASVIGSQARAYAVQHGEDARNYASRVSAEAGVIGAEATAYGSKTRGDTDKFANEIQMELHRNTIAIESANSYLLVIQNSIESVKTIFSINENKFNELQALYQDYIRRIYAYCRVQMPQPQNRR